MEWIRLLLATLISCLCVKYVTCGGTLSLRLKQYINPGGLGANGHHCDGKFGIRMSPCDYVFLFCLDHKQPSYDNMRVCPYGRIQTERILNRDHVTFGSSIGGTPNPIHQKFSEWPGSIYLKVKVYDYDNMGHWDYVDSIQRLIAAAPSSSSSGAPETDFIVNGRTKLTIGVRVFCDYGYYGSSCTKFCVPADSDLGHYECSPDGDKLCHTGWTGVNCNEATDECGPQPCMNGGHCIDLHNDFTCQCEPGFSGQRCETNIDECDPDPCMNGGICIDGANNYTCICDAGFEGYNCEQQVNPCLLGQCENNGTCVPVNHTDYLCECEDEYFGDNCEFKHVPTTTSTTQLPTADNNKHEPGMDVIRKDSSFGTSIRLKVARPVKDSEADSLEPWIVSKLALVENMNASSIEVTISMTDCAGDNGEHVTEMILFIQYSVEGMSKAEVDFIVLYISKFVERGFPHPLYQGRVRDCGTGKISARIDEKDWVDSNWLILAIGGAGLMLIILIIIIVVVFRRRKQRPRRSTVDSYACVIEPNDYEESVPRNKLIVDLRNGTPAFNNDLYCQTEHKRRALPSEPCSDITNGESGYDEDDYYNADAESIYQHVE